MLAVYDLVVSRLSCRIHVTTEQPQSATRQHVSDGRMHPMHGRINVVLKGNPYQLRRMVSQRITPVYPPKGLNITADQIRERRGPRGLTALDGTLLHASPIANGWNQLLGAVRTKGKLPGEIREL